MCPLLYGHEEKGREDKVLLSSIPFSWGIDKKYIVIALFVVKHNTLIKAVANK